MTTADDSSGHGSKFEPNAAPVVVDARGLLCPLPLVKAARAFQGQAPGFVIELWSDDPSAAVDVPEWCGARGHTVVWTGGEATLLRFRLKRGAD